MVYAESSPAGGYGTQKLPGLSRGEGAQPPGEDPPKLYGALAQPQGYPAR